MTDLTQTDRILAALRHAGKSLSTSEIVAATRLDRHAVSNVLGQLFRACRVQRSKAGGPKAGPGRQERRWRLAPEVGR